MDNDKYGRTVEMETIGVKDHYTVSDTETEAVLFVLVFPTGTPESVVYSSINSMAPPDQPIPATIDKGGYLGSIIVEDDVAGPSTVALPVDKITGESVVYSLGSGKIELYLNSNYMALGKDFREIEDEDGFGSEVEILFSLFEGDYLEFRIR